MTGIIQATAAYEDWLAAHVPLVAADLAEKHRLMASGVFPFFRGTAYRWAQRWPIVCEDLTDAPTVLAVGDLHVENFGTWRDAEGRLVWGVNDVDEAADMPYPNDLVRLVASALVAAADARMSVGPDDAASSVLDGYTATLSTGGCPFVLAEHHRILRDLATAAIKDPDRYFAKLLALPSDPDAPPEMIAAVRAALPEGTTDIRVGHRVAGVGSLGRPRVVATGVLFGAAVAREAKAIVPSAWTWATSHDKPAVATAAGSHDKPAGGTPAGSHDTPAGATATGGTAAHAATMERLVRHATRAPDPDWQVSAGRWLVRRLAPDCSRVELIDLPGRARRGQAAPRHGRRDGEPSPRHPRRGGGHRPRPQPPPPSMAHRRRHRHGRRRPVRRRRLAGRLAPRTRRDRMTPRPPASAGRTLSSSSSVRNGPRVLLVEDSPMSARATASMLADGSIGATVSDRRRRRRRRGPPLGPRGGPDRA